MTQSVNRILYGPPGTGKTFHALREAVQLVLGARPPANDVIPEYLRLVEQQRIFPITFHPSYSYEDFVEGYRPYVQDGALLYRVQHGPLRLAIRATGELTARIPGVQYAPAFHVGQVLGGRASTYTVTEVFPSGVQVEAAVRRSNRIADTLTSYVDFWSIERFFACDLDPRFLSGSGQNNEVRQEFSRITGMPSTFTANAGAYRAVYEYLRTLRTSAQPASGETEEPEDVAIDESDDAIDAALGGDDVSSEAAPPAGAPVGPFPVVILIDEINRADLSVVFGELITLIEVDKRQGCAEERVALLPHSGDRLSVPRTLHFVGTMNTADKSISSIDHAMRRRFEWVLVPPEPALCPADYGGVNVAAALGRWNDQVGVLLGPDLLIGHAELMLERLESTRLSKAWGNDEDGRRRALAAVMRSKLVPTLVDCFAGDWERVRRVLGADLVQVARRNVEVMDDEDDQDTLVITISGPAAWWDPESPKWNADRFEVALREASPGGG